jgi:hypothetical protein
MFRIGARLFAPPASQTIGDHRPVTLILIVILIVILISF